MWVYRWIRTYGRTLLVVVLCTDMWNLFIADNLGTEERFVRRHSILRSIEYLWFIINLFGPAMKWREGGVYIPFPASVRSE